MCGVSPRHSLSDVACALTQTCAACHCPQSRQAAAVNGADRAPRAGAGEGALSRITAFAPALQSGYAFSLARLDAL